MKTQRGIKKQGESTKRPKYTYVTQEIDIDTILGYVYKLSAPEHVDEFKLFCFNNDITRYCVLSVGGNRASRLLKWVNFNSSMAARAVAKTMLVFVYIEPI